MRWRLMNAHYLSVPGTEWEYSEITREGKNGRVRFPVPALLDPKNPADQNYPGDIIVCREGKGQPKDIIFMGPPTPDMEPVDDEAREESAKWEGKWKHPIESLSGNFSASLIANFEQQITDAMKRQVNEPKNVGGVSEADFKALQERLAVLEAQNAELKAAKPGRRA